MKKNIKICCLTLALLMLSLICVGCIDMFDDIFANGRISTTEFYNTVNDSQVKLAIVAKAIYLNWYNAIKYYEFGGDITLAVQSALVRNQEVVTAIKNNDKQIKATYKKCKDGEFSDKVNRVMNAYIDYYELVINVSGSFYSYSNDLEVLIEELSSALDALAVEL